LVHKSLNAAYFCTALVHKSLNAADFCHQSFRFDKESQVEQFCRGFEGSVPLNLPEGKKRKANMKQMMIVMGVQWDPMKDPNAGRTLDQTKSSTMRSAMQQIANQTF